MDRETLLTMAREAWMRIDCGDYDQAKESVGALIDEIESAHDVDRALGYTDPETDAFVMPDDEPEVIDLEQTDGGFEVPK